MDYYNIQENLEDLFARKDTLDKTYKPGRWITLSESKVLINLCLDNDIQRYIECGTASGYSASWVATVCEDVHTWDLHDRAKIYDRESFNLTVLKERIVFHHESFSENIGTFLETASRKPTLYFIDGDHAGDSPKEDWNAIAPFLKAGDVVAFHDLREGPVFKAFAKANLVHPRFKKFETERRIGVIYVD